VKQEECRNILQTAVLVRGDVLLHKHSPPFLLITNKQRLKGKGYKTKEGRGTGQQEKMCMSKEVERAVFTSKIGFAYR